MSKFYIRASWWDAPHLGEDEINELLESCEPHLRDARSQGIPAMGAGMVYPVPERDIVVAEAIKIAPWWRRCAAMDVGWRATAVLWGAHDTETDVVYIYDAYLKGQADPEQHASAIRRRDVKEPVYLQIPIAIDPASSGSSQIDGRNLMDIYRREGLHLIKADNSIESGIQEVYGRMVSQRLKIVLNPNTEALLKELRTYRRNERGVIIDKNDYHLSDCLRYLISTGLKIAKPLPMNLSSEQVIGSRKYF